MLFQQTVYLFCADRSPQYSAVGSGHSSIAATARGQGTGIRWAAGSAERSRLLLCQVPLGCHIVVLIEGQRPLVLCVATVQINVLSTFD